MKNKKSKKELTRLILTALILGGGCLYGPVVEADDVECEITTQEPSDEMPTGLTVKTANYRLYANTGYSLKFNYTDNLTDWNDYWIYGGYKYNDHKQTKIICF